MGLLSVPNAAAATLVVVRHVPHILDADLLPCIALYDRYQSLVIHRKYKYPVDEVCSKLRLVADFVDVADLRGQNVVDMLSCGWKDYEDATLHRSAIDEQADCIVTRNKKDFKASSISVLTPAELFDQIESK